MKSLLRNLSDRLVVGRDELLSLCRDAWQTEEAGHEQAVDITRLEQRVMMSATPLAPVAEAVVDAPEQVSDTAESHGTQAATPTDASSVSNASLLQSRDTDTSKAQILIFVDESVEDFQEFLDVENLAVDGEQVEFVVLRSDEDGIAQITDALEGRTDVSEIHVISHGSNGNVHLGNSVLNNASLPAYSGQIASWGNALTVDADILIYGCDVAATSDGELLIDSLAALTDADVAASDDTTGSEALNADWNFEFTVGAVDSTVAFESAFLANFGSTLATVTAFDDTYSLNEGDTLNADSVLNNDRIVGPAVVVTPSVEWDPSQDTNGNSTWEDSTGVSGFDLSIPGGVNYVTNPNVSPGGITAAWDFDGSSTAETNSNFQDLPGDPTDDDAAFEFWFRPTDATIGREVLMDSGWSSGGTSIILNGTDHGGDVHIEFAMGSTTGDFISTTADITSLVNSGEYIHFIGSIDISKGEVKIYVNGTEISKDSNGDIDDWTSASFGASLGIGGRDLTVATTRSGLSDFDGEIGLVRFYEQKFSGGEAQDSYDALTDLQLAPAPQTVTSSQGIDVTVNSDGTFSYDSTGLGPIANGTTLIDTFTYTIDTVTSSSAPAAGTVTLNVSAVNDAPTLDVNAVLSSEYIQDFSQPNGTTSIGDGTSMDSTTGDAQVTGGQLVLNENGVNNSRGTFRIPGVVGANGGWSSSFDVVLDDTGDSNQPSDGISFSYGAIPSTGFNGTEDGWGAVEHLYFGIDTNTGVYSIGVNGTPVATVSQTILAPGGSTTLNIDASWDPVNGASLSVNGTAIFTNQAVAFTAAETHSFAFATRTGGRNVGIALDNLNIAANEALTVGSRTRIPTNLLSASDSDNSSDQIIYTLNSIPANGSLALAGRVLAIGDSFTQKMLEDGLIIYTHDGSANSTDNFNFSITDVLGGVGPTNQTFSISLKGGESADGVIVSSLGTVNPGGFNLGEALVIQSDAGSGINFALEPTGTTGATTSLLDLSSLLGGADIDALHYVGQTVAVNSTITLNTGDLLFSLALSGSLPGLPSANAEDVLVLRTNGTFETILSNPVGSNIQAISLVERDTTIFTGNEIQAGTFLLSYQGATEQDRIDAFIAADPGNGTPAQRTTLFEGSQGDLNFPDVRINSLEFVERGTTIGGVNLVEGQLIVGLKDSNVVAGNSLATTRHQAILIELASDAGGNILSTASTLFDAADIWDENTTNGLDAFSILPASASAVTTGALDPVANDDNYSLNEDTGITRVASNGLLANDDDPDGTITVTSSSSSANSSFSVNPDGSFTYTPIGDFFGTDTLTYTVTDNSGNSVVATATFTVNAVNDAPQTDLNSTASVSQGGNVVLTTAHLDASDVDSADTEIRYRLTSTPTHGDVTLNGTSLGITQFFTQQELIDGAVRYENNGNPASADSFQFQLVDAQGASEGITRTFNINVMATVTISGTVFEDINGDSDLGDAVGIGGVQILLYRDDGDNVISAGDSLVATTNTSGGGTYSFTTTLGDYYVVVDSTTIDPNAGYNTGFGRSDVWAQQTYGTDGALVADGSGGTETRTSSGAYGGRQAAVSDDTASGLLSSQHVTQVTTSGATTGIDFGFSFNVVTNIQDDAGQTQIQGSLRQFLANANAIVGANEMRFVPVEAPNIGTTDQYWRVDVDNVPTIADILASDSSLTHDSTTNKFYRTVAVPADWFTARTNAANAGINGVGGQLVRIDSSYENNLVHGFALAIGNDVFIGGSDTAVEGEWRWSDGDQDGDQFWAGDAGGSAVNGAFVNWASGQPNNPVDDALLMGDSSGHWFDMPAGTPQAYVIEWDAQAILDSYLLPTVSDANTTIDGQAFSFVDGTSARDLNAGTTGSVGAVGLGDDAVAGTGDEFNIDGVSSPDLQIDTVQAQNNRHGIRIEDADHAIVRNLAIRDFGIDGTGVGANLHIVNSDNVLIEDVLIGVDPGATDIANVGLGGNNRGIMVYSADSGTIRNSVVAASADSGVFLTLSNNWTISGNEIQSNSRNTHHQDGIRLFTNSSQNTIEHNFIANNAAFGIDAGEAGNNNTIRDNTITANGTGAGDQGGGIRLDSDQNLVTLNRIDSNRDDGVLVLGDSTDPATHNLITKNSFSDNGERAIDLVSETGSSTSGDGTGAIDGLNATTGNQGFDRPLLLDATLTDGGLDIDLLNFSGNPDIEVYKADPDLTYGQLWFSTGGPGESGGATWGNNEVVTFGDSGDTFEPSGSTSGTFGNLGFEAPNNIRGLHHVHRNLRIGNEPNHFDLRAGDLILSFAGNTTLNSGTPEQFTASREDMVVFRPVNQLDYTESSGEWFMLLDNGIQVPTTENVHALTLVEQDTVVGGTTLTAGTFLVAHSSPGISDIKTVEITGTGSASAATTNLLLSGTALGSNSQIQGLHILSEETLFGGNVLAPAGVILVEVNFTATYAGVSHNANDVLAIQATQTEQDATPGTAATAIKLFDGNSVDLTDGTNESISAITVFTATYGEGQTYVGTLEHNGTEYEFNAPLATTVSAGDQITVIAIDAGGNTSEFSNNVTAFGNNSPNLTLSTNSAIVTDAISTFTSVKVADVTVTDDNFGTNVVSLSGADASLFSLVGDELHIASGASLTPGTFTVTVSVDDATVGASPDSSQTFTLTVTDDNTAPTLTATNVVTSIDEDADTSTSTRIADLAIVDDANGVNVLSLSGANANLFELVGGNLHLQAGVALDHETLSTLVVIVELDDTTIGSTPESLTTFSLSVNDVNDAPQVALANPVANIDENTDTSSAIKVADIVVTDDALGTSTLSLSGTNPTATNFVIAGTELFLRSGTVLDFESDPTLTVTVEVSDASLGPAGVNTVDYTLSVNDVNEVPNLSLTNIVTSIDEDADVGSSTRVANIVIDDDALGTNSLVLRGADRDDFEIVGNELHLKAGVSLDHETQAKLDVRVNVNDFTVGGTPDDSEDLELQIADVNEAPELLGSVPNRLTLLEDALETFVASNWFQDQDAGDVLQYTVVSVDDPWVSVELNSSANTLTVSGAPNEHGSTRLVLRATDQAGLTTDFEVDVVVQPVNDTQPPAEQQHESTNGSPIEGSLLPSNVDADGESLTVVVVRQPDSGQLVVNPDGTFVFTPEPGFLGEATFEFAIDDGVELSTAAEVSIAVAPSPGSIVLNPSDEASQPESPSESELEPEPELEPETPSESADESTEGTTDGGDSSAPSNVAPSPGGSDEDSEEADAGLAPSPANVVGESGVTGGVNAGSILGGGPGGTSYFIPTLLSSSQSSTLALSEFSSLQVSSYDGTLSIAPETLALLSQPGRMWSELDAFKEANAPQTFSSFTAGTVGTATSGLVLGYVIWAIRSGILLSSIVATMPAWNFLDPFVVLENGNPDEEDGESLEDIVESGNEKLEEPTPGSKPEPANEVAER